MRKQITVEEAIKKGHLIVNAPVFIVIIGCPAFAMYLSVQYSIPSWGIGAGFLIGFLFAWLIWSFMITKWRIWAFENVRNVHELKKRAIQEKLIWNDGNIFEKTEIRTAKDKIKLKTLEKKFEQKDKFREDYSLPPKTEIYHSKVDLYVNLIVSILIIGVGIYLFSKGGIKLYILSIITIGIGLYSTIKELRKVLDTKPILIIDSKGIQTKNLAFKNWSTIKSEEVVQEGFGNSAKAYLTFYYDEDKFEITAIDSLNITQQELENIIRTYRIRNNKNNR